MRPAVRSGRCSPRTGWRRGRRTLVGASSSPPPAADHVFDTLGATWWIDAAQEVTDGATSACQWALNRGNQAVPHARLGSTGRAELRGSYGLVLPGVTGNTATVPWFDSSLAAMDVRVRVAFNDWTPSSATTIFTRSGGVGDRYFTFVLNPDGTLTTNFCNTPSQATAAFTVSDGSFLWIRATWTSGTVKIYQASDSDTMPSSWTQVGTNVTGSTVAQTGTSAVTTIAGSNNAVPFTVKRAWISTTIDGAAALDADFTAQSTLATSFTESSANAATVTINSTSGADSNDPLLLTHSGTNYLYLPGLSSNACTIPDAAALRITGDIDIKVRVALADWTPSSRQALTAKRGNAGSNYHHSFCVSTGGAFYFEYGDSSTTVVSASSSVANTLTDGTTYWVRVTRSSSTGDVKFYTAADSPSVPSSWTQLGTTQATAAGSIYAGTDSLCLGGWYAASLSNQMLAGNLYRALIQSGIDGTAVFDADFTANTNQSSFTESSSNAATVTINRATSGRKAVMVTRPVWLFGTDDYMEVADNDLLDMAAADSLTVVMIRRQWGTTPSYGTLVSKTAGGTADGWSLSNNISATSHSFSIADGAAQTYLTGAGCPAYTYGALELAAGVRNVGADTITAYVGTTGGTPATDTTTSDLSSSGPMRIGRAAAGATPYYGEYEVVAVAVFRSALDSTALASIASYFGV